MQIKFILMGGTIGVVSSNPPIVDWHVRLNLKLIKDKRDLSTEMFLIVEHFVSNLSYN